MVLTAIRVQGISSGNASVSGMSHTRLGNSVPVMGYFRVCGQYTRSVQSIGSDISSKCGGMKPKISCVLGHAVFGCIEPDMARNVM